MSAVALVEPDPKRGRGKSAASLALVGAAVRILEEIQPATVRAVCYRLFTAGLIPNMSKNATNKVSKQLVWARESGEIPWPWIVDETRAAEYVMTWDNPSQRIRAAMRNYRRDNWQDQPLRVEVWSEKGTVRGTVSPVLNEYGVTFRVLHGFGSATVLNDIAKLSRASSKPLIVLYVGDFDCSGMYMSEADIPARMNRYAGEITLCRIALTADDVGSALPSFPADSKKGDSRYSWFVDRYGTRCWELDALSPVLLRQRVREAITECLDLDTWNRALMVEKAERESMQDFARAWQASISRQAPKYYPPAN